MIKINLLVPFIDGNLIRKSETLKIITDNPHIDGTRRLFVIEADDEEVTFLKLKYGERNVWKR